MQNLSRRISLLLTATIASAASTRAQCLDFDDRFDLPGTDLEVRAMVRFDDGSGPAAYVAGTFNVAGEAAAKFVARWDGSQWSALGAGPYAAINTLAVFDDGSGPALYAGGVMAPVLGVGNVAYVVKWDGSSWSPVGSEFDLEVDALWVHDDGSGPALYAGGAFNTVGGLTVRHLAKWDGASWSLVGSGTNGSVLALSTYDDGSGPALVVGGSFTTAGVVSANRIATWNGSSWSALGTGVTSTVQALNVFDDGSGPALIAGGLFTTAGGMTVNRVARWDGANWSALGHGFNERVFALSSFDDGSGAALYAGGSFAQSGDAPVARVARWNGATWSPVSSGTNLGSPTSVRALLTIDVGAGRRLLAGGTFRTADDQPSHNVAQWDGANWSPLSKGQGVTDRPGVNSVGINALAVFDDGSGPALHAGGIFRWAGSTSANNIAKWNGSSWSPLDSGTSDGSPDPAVNALAVFDDGSGPALYAGGNFRFAGSEYVLRIAKWNGATWTRLGNGTGVFGLVHALCVFDDGTGPALYAGGHFNFDVAVGVTANRIAKWNGSQWSVLGSGANNDVRALCVFDDGSGPALYAGGDFTTMGGAPADRIAKWDGANWSPVGGGVSGAPTPAPAPHVDALIRFDDGSGDALYAGGEFALAGGTNAARVAKWNGTSWSSLGGGMDGAVSSLAVFNDGAGLALYAGGKFTLADGIDANSIARWNGSAWSSLDGGVAGSGLFRGVNAMAAFDDGADGAPDLYIGGLTTSAGTKPSVGLAEWRGCPPGTGYCFGDGLDRVVTTQCPCANYGAPGHGCANSNGELGGARLSASGSKNPNTVLLSCTGIPNHNLCTFLRGTLDDSAGVSFGDGIRCASGTLLRFARQVSGEDGNAPNAVIATPASGAPGNARFYQVQYRNPSAAFCPPEAFNVSNAYRIDW